MLTLYEQLAVDVARSSNGTHGWTAVEVSYVGSEAIGTVIDRGLAAHGIDTRDALVRVRLDEEVLSEVHYCVAVGDRRLEILFTKESAVHRAVAEGGVLQIQVNTLEAKVEALDAKIEALESDNSKLGVDIVNLKADTDAKIEALESDNSKLQAKFDRLESDKRASIVQNMLKDFGDLFRLRYTETALAKDLEELAGKRNDAVHFLRVGQKFVQNFSALRTYDLSPDMLKKVGTYDSRALLSAKVWIVCEFLKQGLPEDIRENFDGGIEEYVFDELADFVRANLTDADLIAMYEMTEDERKKLTSLLAKQLPELPEVAVLAAAMPGRDRPPLNGTTAAPAAAAPDAAI